jgi:adenylosuccinate synthase
MSLSTVNHAAAAAAAAGSGKSFSAAAPAAPSVRLPRTRAPAAAAVSAAAVGADRAADRVSALSQVSGVLGSQWGDEGKGKLVDVLAPRFDIVARCQVTRDEYDSLSVECLLLL